MKILRIFKNLTNDDCTNLGMEKKGGRLMHVEIPFDSEFAKENIEYIHSNLLSDEEIIQCLLNNDLDAFDDGEEPVLTYLDLLNLGISFITSVKDGKISKEVIVNDALKEAVTDYYLVIDCLDMEGNEMYLSLFPYHRIAAKPISDANAIISILPEITKKLFDNGLVEFEEIDY